MKKSYLQRTLTTKNIAILSMLTAFAYIMQIIVRIPLVPAVGFMSYDTSDIFILLAGFIVNPLGAAIVAIVSGVLYAFTHGQHFLHGAIMNVASSIVFCCIAAAVYRKFKTFSSAMVGLGLAIVATVGVMVGLNLVLTPLFMGFPRDAVVGLILPGIVPFNLLKYSLSAALFVMIYSPSYKALQATGVLPKQTELAPKRIKANPIILAAVVALVVVGIILLFRLDVI